MYIDFKVYETSKVERTSAKADILQGESNHTILRFDLPQTIRGYPTANYTCEIKFESNKGEVLRFGVDNREFALNSDITKHKSVKAQLVLTNTIDEAEPIEWRTMLFGFDFIPSINAVERKGVNT